MYSIERETGFIPGIVYNKQLKISSTSRYRRLIDKLKESQGERCSTCGRLTNNIPNDDLQFCVEHLLDKYTYRNKKNDWDNLVGCCRQCNLSRASNERIIGKKMVVSPIHTEYFNLTDYYYFNEFTGEIKVKREWVMDDRLEYTRKVYGLDSQSLNEDRLKYLSVVQSGQLDELLKEKISNLDLDDSSIIYPFVLMVATSLTDFRRRLNKNLVEIYKNRG